MDFAPHTPDDDRAMLEVIGMSSIADLFEPVPPALTRSEPLDVPPALSEIELARHLRELSERSLGAADLTCFAGGGAYDHHVPAAVKHLASRAEFATSYTPYQPELSQGVLQAVFEFQTAVCELYGLEVANASLYDGANALVEAVNLAQRVTHRSTAVIASTVHPHYREVLRTYTSGLGLELELAGHGADGTVAWDGISAAEPAAVVVAYPNFFGHLEDLDAAARWAHERGALLVVVADPTAMGVLRAPGEAGADVAVGEGHALGNPLSYGGPYVGLFATKLDLVRQVPGRIAGATEDADGRRAFVLTLQAREQHIRRAKATSNVCTNQTLMAIAAAIHLAWLGPGGLRRLGELCLAGTAAAGRRLADVRGVQIVFDGPRFKELVVRTPVRGEEMVAALGRRGYLVGPALGRWYPDLADAFLVAVTEKRTTEDVAGLAEALEKELAER